MVCKKPFKSHGCGQCLPCLIKSRRVWTHRCMLEAALHENNCFATLTYRFVQYSGLSKTTAAFDVEHVQRFFYRLRKAGIKVRYYGVGEYGENFERPHLHFILFGYPNCFYGRSRYSRSVRNCCPSCDQIRDAWRLGNVDLGSATKDSIAYVAGYVTEKADDKKKSLLLGRPRSRAFMSRNPGIGSGFARVLASNFASEGGSQFLIREGDVPHVLKHGPKEFPLGRYMMEKFRESMGFPLRRPKATSDRTTYKPEGWEVRMSEKMCELFAAHGGDQKKIVAAKKQKILNLESKHNIFKGRKKL